MSQQWVGQKMVLGKGMLRAEAGFCYLHACFAGVSALQVGRVPGHVDVSPENKRSGESSNLLGTGAVTKDTVSGV